MISVIIFILVFGLGGALRVGYEHLKGGDKRE